MQNILKFFRTATSHNIFVYTDKRNQKRQSVRIEITKTMENPLFQKNNSLLYSLNNIYIVLANSLSMYCGISIPVSQPTSKGKKLLRLKKIVGHTETST